MGRGSDSNLRVTSSFFHSVPSFLLYFVPVLLVARFFLVSFVSLSFCFFPTYVCNLPCDFIPSFPYSLFELSFALFCFFFAFLSLSLFLLTFPFFISQSAPSTFPIVFRNFVPLIHFSFFPFS